jgi:CSLREA domain-containing protein
LNCRAGFRTRLIRSVAGLFLLAGFTTSRTSAATITVNTTSDSSTSGDGSCSLREAIVNANSNADLSSGDCTPGDAGLDIIVFKIAGTSPFTIVPTLPLPVITDPMILDATSQPGFSGTPIVELDGENAGGDGIEISAGGSVIEGFVVDRFTGAGIAVDSGESTVIRGNWVGIDNTGTVASANGYGVGAAPLTTIGGSSPGDRNVISGNANIGLILGDHCTVQGNYIGTSASGMAAIPNLTNGIAVQGVDCLLGGTTPGSGNVVSGNIGAGIYIAGIAGNAGLVVQGNFIGTDATGMHALGNSDAGIQFFTSTGNLVGGTVPGSANVISGNSSGVVIGSFLFSADENVVEGNFIGTDVTGTVALPNGNGVTIFNSLNNRVGGPSPAQRNVISGNSGGAVFISVSQFGDHPGNTVEGNFLGTDVTGTLPVGNGHGVAVESVTTGNDGAVIRGNLISGNVVAFETNTGASLIVGNHIGTSSDGHTAIPNSRGVEISGVANRVGGVVPGESNVISGNLGDGISLTGGVARSNLIEGNLIGLNEFGEALSNGRYGIEISDAIDTLVGGLSSGAPNVIAFNKNGGIGIGLLEFGEAVGNKFISNSIHDNGGLGIDLLEDGPSPNGSISTLAQHQTFPNLMHVLRSPTDGRLFILGSQVSDPAFGANEVQYFRADGDPSGYGEGKDLLRDDSGLPSGSFAIATGPFVPIVPVAVGDPVTATATTSNGTSEFSANVPVAANAVPIANAGSSQTVTRGASVFLDGSASSDPDALPSGPGIVDGRFAWTQTFGAPVILTNPTTHDPSFQALSVGFRRFSLVVNDGLDSSTNVSNVTIGVVNPDDHSVPTAVPQTVSVPPNGSVVIQLVAVDPDNTSFLFAIIQPPAHGSLTNFDPLTGTVDYLPSPGFVGTDAFQFTASDGTSVSAPDTVTILVGVGIAQIPTLSRVAMFLLAITLALAAGFVLRR